MKAEQELFADQPPAEVQEAQDQQTADSQSSKKEGEQEESGSLVVYQEETQQSQQQEKEEEKEIHDATYEIIDDTQKEKVEDPVFEMLDSPIDEQAKLDLGKRLATFTQAIKNLEDEKKAFDKDINDRIKENQSLAEGLAREFLFGFTKQRVECFWKTDDPEPGVKSLYRKDSGQFVRKMSMDLFDSKKQDGNIQESQEIVPEPLAEIDLISEPTETILENAQEAPQELNDDEVKELVRQGLERGYSAKCAHCGKVYKATATDLREYYKGQGFKFICAHCFNKGKKKNKAIMVECYTCENNYKATEEDLLKLNDPKYQFIAEDFICPECIRIKEAVVNGLNDEEELIDEDNEPWVQL